jgi:asparagine synthase (glutamine-hydrolysing)
MCGIAGVVHADGLRATAAVRAMTDAQAHRGPDGEGVVTLDVGPRTLALGHRRLAIVDPSPAAAQPMSNPDTGDVIVYNGMLYNYRALRDELASTGERFRSASDTEVILRAFARWGADCLARLSGMFAFAFYERRTRRLHLARDPLGIKPLYVAVAAETIVFASELQAIVASGLIERRIDRRALASAFAYGAVADPLTMIEGVVSLDAGSHLAIDLGAERLEGDRRLANRFFSFPVEPERAPVARVAADLHPILREVVASHMQSDVPIGIFLSRGIDSTAIACLASELRGGDVDTFTVGLADDPQIDEGPTAGRTARALGTRHHDLRIPEAEVQSLVAQAFACVDQPSVDGLNTFILSRALRDRSIKVALSGLGGDEMFGGYPTFREVPMLRRALSLASFVPAAARRRATSALLARRPPAQRQKEIELASTEPTIEDVYFRRRRLMSDAQMQTLGFTPDPRDRAFIPRESEPSRGVAQNDDWAAVRTLETRSYLGNTLLRDADVFGMANGLEIRVPLLGREIVETVFKYSRAAFGSRRRNKPWLVSAVGDRMPQEVRRMPKRGFVLPQSRWMRTSLRDEFEARVSLLAESGLVERDGPRSIWQSFLVDPQGASWSRAWMLGVVGNWLARRSAQESGNDGNERAPPHSVERDRRNGARSFE